MRKTKNKLDKDKLDGQFVKGAARRNMLKGKCNTKDLKFVFRSFILC